MIDEHEPRPQRRLSVAGFAVLAVAFLVSLVLGVLAVDSVVTKRSPVDLFGSLFVQPPQQYFHKDRIALLLMGIDYDYDSKDQPYSSNARTDTIMAVALNFPTAEDPRGSVGILSVPRDMDYTFPDGHEDKINAAYAAGKNSVDDAHHSETAVARFLGLRGFDRFVTLRIDAAKELVDAIGGIDVIPDETMDYDDNWGHLHIHFKGGKLYHMNGDQAVSYSRFRHDACSDPCRIRRQQQVVRIVMRKLESDKFNDLVHVNDLIGVVRRNVVTDLSDSEALSLAVALRGVDLKSVKMNQVPFVADKVLNCCGDVIVADDDAKAQLVRQIFVNPPMSGAPPSAAAVAAVAPGSVTVSVLNGSGIPGMARRVADRLHTRGFKIATVGNADVATYDTTEVRVTPQESLQGYRVRGALPVKGAVVTADASSGAVPLVTVVVGRDAGAAPEREADAVK